MLQHERREYVTWRHYDALATIAQDYLVDGEFGISAWLLKTVTHSQPHN
jgi:hypothetical protein